MWFDPESDLYQRDLPAQVPWFQSLTDQTSRFEAVILTPHMRQAAWQHGQRSQMILDGTFGVCTSKLLCFILMVLNENRHGLPVGFLLFSAHEGSNGTAGSYDTRILTKSIRKWREASESGSSRTFSPSLIITDNDIKERGALSIIWPESRLLLCRFHATQSWKNKTSRVFQGIRKPTQDTPEEAKAIVKAIRDALTATQKEILKSTDYDVALDAVLLLDERMQRLSLDPNVCISDAANACLNFIAYLRKGWLQGEEFFSSWPAAGRHAAAKDLNIPVAHVLNTTNHLESFNNVLKNGHIASHKRNGHRLRIDSFLTLLVNRIIPDIYNMRMIENEDIVHKREMIFRADPDFKARLRATAKSVVMEKDVSLAWQDPEEPRFAAREIDAEEIISKGWLRYHSSNATGLCNHEDQFEDRPRCRVLSGGSYGRSRVGLDGSSA